jgi:hypothetical protein
MSKTKMYKSISVISGAVLLSAVITFNACNDKDNNDNSPTEAGIKKAQELCECFKKPTTEEAVSCVTNLNKQEKYLKYEENADFEQAFHTERENCDAETPDWW